MALVPHPIDEHRGTAGSIRLICIFGLERRDPDGFGRGVSLASAWPLGRFDPHFGGRETTGVENYADSTLFPDMVLESFFTVLVAPLSLAFSS
jgi:hypothetical protein